jgi:rubrerythrin
MVSVIEVKLAVYLDLCHEIEETAAKLYYFFADLFRQDAEIRSLWLRTAIEEENHALQFRMVSRMRKEVIDGDFVELADVRTVLARMRGVLARVSQQPPTLREALQLAIEEEENLSSFHVHSAVTFVTDTSRAVFKAMMVNDRDHVERMKRAVNRCIATAAGHGAEAGNSPAGVRPASLRVVGK